MRIGTLSFAPRPVTTIAAVLFLALLVWLGLWQARRAEEKQGRQALLEARMAQAPLSLTGAVPSAEPLLYRRVRAAGEWIPEGQVFLDNQMHAGRVGFHVVTPLRLKGRREAVLVNRGWVARDTRQYPRAPQVAVPGGVQEVHGLATVPPARYLELAAETITGNVWQNLSLARYREHMRIDVLPVVVLADEPAPGLAAVRETPNAGVAKHREYSLTWFALAATTLVLWLVLNTRRSP